MSEKENTPEITPHLEDSLALIRESISVDRPTVIGLGDFHYSNSIDAFHLEVVRDLLSGGYKIGGIFLENLSFDYPHELVGALASQKLDDKTTKQINTVEKRIRSGRSEIAQLAFRHNIPIQLLINEDHDNCDPDPEYARQVSEKMSQQKEALVYIIIAGKNHVAKDGLKVDPDRSYHSVIQMLRKTVEANTLSCNIFEVLDSSIKNFTNLPSNIDFNGSSSVGFKTSEITDSSTYRINDYNLMTLADYDLVLFVK